MSENDRKSFCGSVVVAESDNLPTFIGKTVFLAGDISKTKGLNLDIANQVFIIRDYSYGYNGSISWQVIPWGRAPITVHNVGVFYRQFFDPTIDHFNQLQSDHTFQALTESTKPGTAHRTGIYLTPVERHHDELHFRLLRCSSNLSGPTGNFRAHDHALVSALNKEASAIFDQPALLNHVLAQIYRNTPGDGKHAKQTKAKIKEHSDKTKDMPTNGIMAFCTFYTGLEKLSPMGKDPFDYGHRDISGLTTLYFRLKPEVAERAECNMTKQFCVTLYPNSAFLMPLSTNRLYTHEIRPSALDAVMLPTRLGYVVRCSNCEAVFKNGQTYLKSPQTEALTPLVPPTEEGMRIVRDLYAQENRTTSYINYGSVLFSMNRGDYQAPDLHPIEDGFRWFALAPPERRDLELNEIGEDSFRVLKHSVRFEDVSKGRQGAVLIACEETLTQVPIVRTTTQYTLPSQPFRPIHYKLAQRIQQVANLSHCLNNALIELYTPLYATMGFHSDQALDLQEGSSVAVFSSYRFPDKPNRKLIIESKEPGGRTWEILMTHNSVVVFSADTNRRFRHKIILDRSLLGSGGSAGKSDENEWLGVTFRTSKTFVNYEIRDESGANSFSSTGSSIGQYNVIIASNCDSSVLTLATDTQRKEFYKLRGQENAELDFTYPEVTFTISESDLQPPVSFANHVQK